MYYYTVIDTYYILKIAIVNFFHILAIHFFFNFYTLILLFTGVQFYKNSTLELLYSIIRNINFKYCQCSTFQNEYFVFVC